MKDTILIKNIKELVQVEDQQLTMRAGKQMSELNTINNAYLLIEDGKILDFGKMDKAPDSFSIKHQDYLTIDASGKMVFPTFCDSHTHLVYPASREIEYVDKIKGLSYEEIAKRGGGILNTARKMQDISEDELYESAMERLKEITSMGTGAVEIKSGYGLTTGNILQL